MYENIAEIAKNFNIVPLNIYKYRYYYVLNCANGAYSLSLARPRPSGINEIHRVKQCLNDYGIHNIDTYCTSSKGLPYHEEEGKIYVVTRFFGSNELDFMNNTQVSIALSDIGRVHKGLRLMGEEMLYAAGNTNNTLNMYKSKQKSLESISRLLRSKGRRYWDKERLSAFSALIDNCRELLTRLEEMDYGRSATYCHGALKEGNIIYKKGRTYIIDWDNMKYLSFIEDIAFFIGRYIRKNCFYAEREGMGYMGLEEALAKYTRYTSLSDYDYNALKIVLEYPRRFVSTLEEFFALSRSFVPTGIANKLDEALIQRDFAVAYIKT